MLRETSVLGLRCTGRGREGRVFVTTVIEGEDEEVMKGGVWDLEWVIGEDGVTSRDDIYRWACLSHRKKAGEHGSRHRRTPLSDLGKSKTS